MLRWNGDGGRRPQLLIGDPSPLLVEALAALLAGHGYATSARASDGEAAADALAAGGIDAAILDIELAAPTVLAMIEQLGVRGQRLPVIVLAPCADHPGIAAVIDSAARGLVLKSESAECLAHCLATVTAGGQWFDRSAMARALDRAHAANGAAQLTRRERDVARLVAAGQRNRGIAGVLGISEGTVKMHLHNVYAKLGLESRTQLAMDERLRMLG